MADVFDEDAPALELQRLWELIEATPWLHWQILTKRPHRIADVAPAEWMREPRPNVWWGTSVENPAVLERVGALRAVPAALRFLSVEPLLERIPRLPLDGIHWVIVGGESGARARPMQEPWVRLIRDACIASGVPFFFKQWGGRYNKANGRALDGRTWDEIPDVGTPSGGECTREAGERRLRSRA
jgi:protein gp37